MFMNRKLLVFLWTLLLSEVAWAAQPLSDAQMDRVTGGISLGCPPGFTCSISSGTGAGLNFACPGCASGSLAFTPTSTNIQTFFTQLSSFLTLNGFGLVTGH